MKVIDDNTKKLYWWNRNYFFVTTVLIVVLNITLYGVLGNKWERFITEDKEWILKHILNFSNLARHFLGSFSQSSWDHCLLNMLCFFFVGIYLERKKGTIPLFLLVLVMTFFTSVTTGANNFSDFMHGFSGVNYGLYAYVIIDYCFIFKKNKPTKFNIISGAVLLALIYFAMCFKSGTTEVAFTWYPADLISNIAHYSSFVSGLVLGLTINVIMIMCEKQNEKEANEA